MRCGRRLRVGNYMTADFAVSPHWRIKDLTMYGPPYGVGGWKQSGLPLSGNRIALVRRSQVCFQQSPALSSYAN